jgi:hypothetical protein
MLEKKKSVFLHFLKFKKNINMNTNTLSATPNFESVWAILQETAQRQKENERILNEKFAETGRLFKEAREEMKENERILNEKFAETALQMKETDRLFKETDRKMQETDRKMQNLQNELGGIGQSQGSFAEEYFYNSFEKEQKNFFGKKFDDIQKNVKGRLNNIKDEYDIVLYNSDSVAIIEVKFKVRKDYIDTLIKKAETFKILCPYYKDFNIYLGLASMIFPPHLEQDCMQRGIAVIKQVGDTVVIHDENLKVF